MTELDSQDANRNSMRGVKKNVRKTKENEICAEGAKIFS